MICNGVFVIQDALIKSKSKTEEKAKWCYHAMKKMDDLLDDETKHTVRLDCACNLGGKYHKVNKDIYKNYKTKIDRINAYNTIHKNIGTTIKILDNGRYELTFWNEHKTEFKCVCLKGLGLEWSSTWCLCCGGHVKHHLETMLGVKLEVKFLSSALNSNGKENCRFELWEV